MVAVEVLRKHLSSFKVAVVPELVFDSVLPMTRPEITQALRAELGLDCIALHGPV